MGRCGARRDLTASAACPLGRAGGTPNAMTSAALTRDPTLSTAIGLISGTSMDGIDVALVQTDGESIVRTGPGRMMSYPPALKAELLDFLEDPSLAERDPLTDLEARVTNAFTEALLRFLDAERISAQDVDLIGLHGQTVWHRPERRFTRQLGDGRMLARATGLPVVDGFRQADVQAGGQGAPLAPLYHAALVSELPKPLVVLNLGGVGNITYVGEADILAFDTGPASALMDDLVRRRFQRQYDEGGAIAKAGTVNAPVLAAMLADPFFAVPPPKSLDRQHFHNLAQAVESLSDYDAVATLSAFTVESLVKALDHVPARPLRWLVGGGGRLNTHLMERLAFRLEVPVEPIDAIGWDGDLLEAQLFAYLAVRSRKGLPLSLPTTTAVPRPMTGGVFWPA
jgi:anhydro-N-acetylmuramic acid kinase